jgi:hypothetical protein
MQKDYHQLIDKYYGIAVDYFNQYEEKISIDIEKVRFDQTSKALYRFIKKIMSVHNVIKSMNPLNDYYPIQILHRAIIEHFLVAYYISTKCHVDYSDKCGKDYFRSYFFSEYIKQKYYDLRVEGILKNEAKNDSLENFNKTQKKIFSQADIMKFHTNASQFDIRKIVKYLLHNVPKLKFYEDRNTNIHKLLYQYNRVSSFVHGGGYADAIEFELSNVEKNKKLIVRTIYFTKTSLAFLIEDLFMILRIDKDTYTLFANNLTTLRLEIES